MILFVFTHITVNKEPTTETCLRGFKKFRFSHAIVSYIILVLYSVNHTNQGKNEKNKTLIVKQLSESRIGRLQTDGLNKDKTRNKTKRNCAP